jgi:hypothetical protein
MSYLLFGDACVTGVWWHKRIVLSGAISQKYVNHFDQDWSIEFFNRGILLIARHYPSEDISEFERTLNRQL